MAKIPFDIKHRDKIESGEYKVETRDGRLVRIICWDRVAKENTDDDLNICVLVPEDNGEAVYYYHQSGKRWVPDKRFDLFIITQEPELTEFEKNYIRIAHKMEPEEYNDEGLNIAKKEAAELLDLARKEFYQTEGYVIEKKAFHDAVENISDKHRAEMSVEYSIHCKIEDGTRHAVMNWDTFQKVAQKFIDIGKAEALKGLPQWGNLKRKCNSLGFYPCVGISMTGEDMLYCGDKCISIKSLEKLPGFKADEEWVKRNT